MDIEDLHHDVCKLAIRICSPIAWNGAHTMPRIHLKVQDALIRTRIGVDKVRVRRNKLLDSGHVKVCHVKTVCAFKPVLAALSGDQAISTLV